MFSQIQLIALGVIVAGLISGVYFYHFKPISNLEKRIEVLEEIVEKRNRTIISLDKDLRKCEEEKKQQGFEEYVKGLSDEINTTDYPKFTF